MRTVGGGFPGLPRYDLIVILVAIAPRGSNFVDGGRAADLVAGHHQRPSVRAVPGVDEDEALGAKVAGFGLARSRSDGEVAVVDVLNKAWRRRIADVIHDNAANAFETDKRIGPAENLSDYNALWLWALVVTAVVKSVVGIRGVEI